MRDFEVIKGSEDHTKEAFWWSETRISRVATELSVLTRRRTVDDLTLVSSPGFPDFFRNDGLRGWVSDAFSPAEASCGWRSRAPSECYFWATHQGAELDLLIVRGQRRLGFEFKRASSPTATPSMRSAQQDLDLTQLDVIHAGPATLAMGDRMRAIPLERITADLKPLRPR